MGEFFTKEETVEQHNAMTSAISAEIQGVQSSINSQIKDLATTAQMEAMDIKIEEVLKVFNSILLALRLTTKGGRFIYKSALMVAPFIVAVAVIWTFIKSGLASVALKFYP